jgi:glycosyltransferase involved in cell wall biosynthesis
MIAGKEHLRYDIAVVIATYRRPLLLRPCLECLTRQTIPGNRFQVIVVSDGHDQETQQVVEDFKTRYRDRSFVYSHTSNKEGPASARNTGWKLADAAWIAFTDDDCLPEPGWLQNFLRASVTYQQLSVMTGRVIVPVSGVPTDYEKNISALESADFVTANCCCPKHFLEAVGGFDTSYKMAWREDSDLHFRFLQYAIRIEKVNDAIVDHPVRKATWGISIREQRKSMYNALLFKKYPAYYRSLIARYPVWKYYLIVLSFISGSIFFLAGYITAGLIFMANFFAWVTAFTCLRLKGTSKSLKHITEMFLTSIIIPFISIYWTLYGSVKYKVFFL